MFRLIIATSSSFTDYDLFRTKLDHLLQNQQDVELCAGFSTAGDAMISKYAAETNRLVKPFDSGFRGMYQALIYAQAAVFFHDGSSGGVAKYIEQARQCKLKVKVINFTHDLDKAIPAGKPRKRNMVVIDGQELVLEQKKAKPKKKLPPADPSWKRPYQQAHERWFAKEYPGTYADKHYVEPNYPDPRTTNGITAIIINYLKFEGHYSNRQNVQGRQVGEITKTASGATFNDRKWIKSSTRKGASDIMAAINGRMIAIEVKNANTKDTIKKSQEKEQMRVEKSGAVYVVITSVAEFFEWYDRYMQEYPI